MIRAAAFILALLFAGPALAQGCGASNPNCVVPTAPTSANDNRAASTAFVHANAGSTIDAGGATSITNGTSNQCAYDNSGKLALHPCAYEPQAYGASGSGKTTTGTVSASSATLSLAAALDFINGQGIRIDHAGPAYVLNAPTSASATFHGTGGATTYVYTIAAMDSAGGVGAAIATFNCTSANATLSQTNYCQLAWTAPTGTAPFAYAVYRASQLIAITVQTTFYDPGLGGYGYGPPWLPTTPPGSASADWLVTTVSSGGGTTSLTLAASATTAVSSGNVYHDDTTALQSCITAAVTVSGVCHVPSGQYRTTASLNVAGPQGGFRLTGDQAVGTRNDYYALQGATFLNDATTTLGTTILPNMTNSGLFITTNDAHEIDHLGIVYSYPPPPYSGISAIVDSGTGGPVFFSLSGSGTAASPIVTGLVSTTFLYVGAQCYINSIGYTIASVDSSTQVHLSANYTSTGALTLVCANEATVSQTGSVTNGSTTVTGLTGAANLSAGMIVTGPDIPFNTNIQSVTNSTTIVLTQNATGTSGSEPLVFAFGLQTGAHIHDNLLAQADRLLAITNSTEFHHHDNKFYNEQSYGVILNLQFGNGDWGFGPNNVMVGGGLYPASFDILNNLPFIHFYEQTGGGGRFFGNKLNTIGASGATAYGYYINPVTNYTSVEPPTITGNSFEGLYAAIAFYNGCPIQTTCGVYQTSITGNQMWNTYAIYASSASNWISGLVFSGNEVNVNGAVSGAYHIYVYNDATNWNVSGNQFGVTGAGLVAQAYSFNSGSTGVYTHGNQATTQTSLGTGNASLGSFSGCNSGSTITNTFTNRVEAHLYGGTNVGVVYHNGSIIWGGSNITISPSMSIELGPGDTMSVTTNSGTCPTVSYTAIDP